MLFRCLLLSTVFFIFPQAALAKSDFCNGFERGFKAEAGSRSFVPFCPFMSFTNQRPKSDYEFGFLKGVEKAKENNNQSSVVSPPVVSNLQNDCSCSKAAKMAIFREMSKGSLLSKTPAQRRKEEELAELRRQAEIEALNAQIRQSKGIGTPVRAKLTPTLAKQNTAQQAVVKEKIDKVGSLIAKLASGGSQETRQKNYDAVVAAQTDLLKTYSSFYSDWMEPKYYR